MSRHDEERLHDILDAIRAIRKHLERGDLSDGLIYDAVRTRLLTRRPLETRRLTGRFWARS